MNGKIKKKGEEEKEKEREEKDNRFILWKKHNSKRSGVSWKVGREKCVSNFPREKFRDEISIPGLILGYRPSCCSQYRNVTRLFTMKQKMSLARSGLNTVCASDTSQRIRKSTFWGSKVFYPVAFTALKILPFLVINNYYVTERGRQNKLNRITLNK